RSSQAAYWAAVTTLIVMQSTLGAPLTVSLRRFIGTILGAGPGALLTTLFGPNILAFGIGIFALGILCTWIGQAHPKPPEYLERSTYRFGSVAFSSLCWSSGTTDLGSSVSTQFPRFR